MSYYDLKFDIETEVKELIYKGELTSYDDVWEYVAEEVDRAVIYTVDCYDLLKSLMICDFEDAIANGYNTISGIAFHYVREELLDDCMRNFEEMLEDYEMNVCEDCGCYECECEEEEISVYVE